jgi:hypothetical protein
MLPYFLCLLPHSKLKDILVAAWHSLIYLILLLVLHFALENFASAREDVFDNLPGAGLRSHGFGTHREVPPWCC